MGVVSMNDHINMGMILDIWPKIALSIGIALIIWAVRWLIQWGLTPYSRTTPAIYTIQNLTRTGVFIVGVVIMGTVWLRGVQSFGTFFGLFTAGMAIALKDVVINFAGWLYLLWQAPFKIGDRIQIQDHQGDVIDIGAFKFTLLEIGNWVDTNQSTGRIIQISNSDIFNQSIANYSKGFNYIWNELPVVITSDSNWKKAKQILQTMIDGYYETYAADLTQELQKARAHFPIHYNHITPIIYTTSSDHGICLTIRYLITPRRIRQSIHDLWEKILDVVDENNDIDLACQTYRAIVDSPLDTVLPPHGGTIIPPTP